MRALWAACNARADHLQALLGNVWGRRMNNDALISRLANARSIASERLPASDVQAIDDAIHALRQATSDETAVIRSLIDLARQVDHALDDSEEVDYSGYRSHNIAGQDFDDVVDALDALEDLPDDKPGMTLGPAGKAEWALRRLLPNTAVSGPQRPKENNDD